MVSLKTQFPFLIFVAFSSLLVNFSYCFNPKGGYIDGVATWYGPPNGDGSDERSCSFRDTISQPPINSLIAAAGSIKLFERCGACYQVVCTSHPACNGNPITVTISDECPGRCEENSTSHHFILSGRAISAMAKPGQADTLRHAGPLNIGFKRVPCNWNLNISFYIGTLSGYLDYLAFTTEYINGDGDLGNVEIKPAGSSEWIGMRPFIGSLWKVETHGAKGPYSVRITTATSKRQIVATDAIPANYKVGETYWSNVNF